MLGISLAFPLAIGLSLALGSLLTLAAKDPAALLSAGGLVDRGGRGRGRERGRGVLDRRGPAGPAAGRSTADAATVGPDGSRRRPHRWDSPWRSPSGLFDPMLNFAFQFGGRIEAAAAAHGAHPLACSDALWVWPLLGSFVVNAAYCSFLLTRNRTWQRYWQPGTASHWALAALMGLIWMGSITLYGRGASLMGSYGKSVGWAVFYCAIILFSGLWGIAVRRMARRRRGGPLRTMLAGLAVLAAAFVVLGYGNHLFERLERTSASVQGAMP